MISIRLSLVGAQVDCQHEHVFAAHVLVDLDHHFAVGINLETTALPSGDTEVFDNSFGPVPGLACR